MVENNDLKRSNKDNKNQFNKFKAFWILLLIVVILIIGVGVYILYSQKNATGQLESFQKAVNNSEYEKISNQLSNNDIEVTKNDAKHLTNYLKEPENKTRFNKQIEKIKHNIKQKNDVDKGHITDKTGKTIIEVRQNGKSFFIFDELKFDPQFFDVYIKGSNTEATYQYKNGHNNKFTTLSEANKVTKIGRFIAGKYNVDAKKIFKNDVKDGATNGNFFINTDNRTKDGKVMAKDHFNQAWFEVDLKNTDTLDGNSFKLYINNKEVDYKDGMRYGKYPINSPLNVYIKGKSDDKIFKTNKAIVKDKDTIKPQIIKLEFDENEIEKHKKQIEKKKEEAQSFMNEYTEDLNKAYKHHNYKYVSKYFEKDTEVAKHIKGMTEGKQKLKYSKLKYLKTSVEGSNVHIELSKKNNKGNTIKSSYQLKYNNKNEQFKIVEYQDI